MRRRSGGDVGYPSGLMASRLRLRRMLCFLKHHGLTAAARELERETGVFLDAAYMEHLMRIGSWDKADDYLQRFLPYPEDRSPQSECLVVHLRCAWTLAAVAAGGPDAAEFASTFDEEHLFEGPGLSHFRKVLHKMHADQPRASKLWKKLAPSVVTLVMDTLTECPELKGKLHLPRHRPMPWEVTPLIGAWGSQRRRSKAADRTPPDVVIRTIKRKKRLLSSQETNAFSGFPSNASSSSVALLNTKIEPVILGEVSSNALNSVALKKETKQIAPLGEQVMENVETALEKQDVAQL